MAVHARHRIAEPPQAPPRETTGQLLLRAYVVLLLVVALATTFWFNLLGAVGLVILVGATSVVSAVVWIVLRPPVSARRLPWFPLVYLVWAAASVLWTHWLDVTILTWALLACTTFQGLFVASVTTWRELVGAIASALRWILGLSLLFELWAALVVRGPILPNFIVWDGDYVKELAWTRAQLFDLDGRIQGIVGNAHLMAIAALLAIVVFAILLAEKATAGRRAWLIAWLVLAALLLWRSESATVWIALASVVLVLVTALLMRRTSQPGERTKYYVVYTILGGLIAGLAWTFREAILDLFGKSGTLTGRAGIWEAVLARIEDHPIIGWGFATPWVPWDPAFDNWIIINGLPVFHAHNVWLDVLFQLGAVGVLIVATAYLALIWRSWFFAIDRPRFDLVADRPYQAITLLPLLIVTIMLVQGIAESRPLMEWGWMFLVMFGMKIKQAPLVGEGPTEHRLAMERGDLIDRRPGRARR